MEKEVSTKPAVKKRTSSESGKKDTRKTRTTRQTPAKGKKKSTRATKAPAKSSVVSKAASPGKNKPAAKKHVSPKTGVPSKTARRKPAPRPKAQKETNPPKPPTPPAQREDAHKVVKPAAWNGPEDRIKAAESLSTPAVSPSEATQAPTEETHPPDPFKKMIRVFGISLIILIGLLVLTSYQNMKKYFITSRHGAVEIWKGKFSPKGRDRVVIMPGIQPPEQTKTHYTREEVFPLVFQYYIGKADALMQVPGVPDFVGIKSYLKRALSYATTDSLRTTAKSRINSIDLMILLFKADAAANKGTLAGFEAAITYLDQAAALNPDTIQKKLIQQKLESIEKLKEIVRPQPKKTKSVKDKP